MLNCAMISDTLSGRVNKIFEASLYEKSFPTQDVIYAISYV